MTSGLFLRIDASEYRVRLLPGVIELTKLGQARHGGGNVYAVRRVFDGRLRCDCGDATYRRERRHGCKHISAVEACGLAVLVGHEQPDGELVATSEEPDWGEPDWDDPGDWGE